MENRLVGMESINCIAKGAQFFKGNYNFEINAKNSSKLIKCNKYIHFLQFCILLSEQQLKYQNLIELFIHTSRVNTNCV